MPAISSSAAAPPISASGRPVNGSILRTSAAKPLLWCAGAASGAPWPGPDWPLGVGRLTAGGAGRADSVEVDVAVGVGVPAERFGVCGATGPITWFGGGSGLWCGGVVVGVGVGTVSRGLGVAVVVLGVAFGVFDGVALGVADGVSLGVADGVGDSLATSLGVSDGTGLVTFTGGGSGVAVRVTVSVTVGVGDASDPVTVTDGVAIGAGPAVGRCG